jgi:hypothetical protein
MHRSLLALALLGVLWPSLPSRADSPKRLDERALAARIDALIAAGWNDKKATPSPRADDAEFLRRVYLDLTGRIPDILEARDFLDNPASDKRNELITRLLASDRFPAHLAALYRGWWIPDNNNPFGFNNSPLLENWLLTELKAGSSYQKIVARLIDPREGGAGNASAVFQQTYGPQPENQAGVTARLFLGIKIECAQCHNHPFARWTRKQFWEYAAFFNLINPGMRSRARNEAGGRNVAMREIEIPGTGKKVSARFPDGSEPTWKADSNSRQVLAEWISRRDNPYLARAAVNRLWEYLLGTGLVDPVDDGGPDNPASHPELLDELAEQFVEHDFSLSYLIGAITRSQTYQRTSRTTHPSQDDPRLFARSRVRGMTPEQLYDSLVLATGNREDTAPMVRDGRRLGVYGTARQMFVQRFPNVDQRTEQRTSILQALYLMNGNVVSDAVSLDYNKNLAIIAEATSVRTSRRIEQLFLITLSRKARPEELARLIPYVDKGGPTGDSRQALCDVFWALLNSSEFSVNH